MFGSSIPQRFAAILRRVLAVVAAQQGGGIHPQGMETAAVTHITTRIRQIYARFAAIAARAAHGTLRRTPIPLPRPDTGRGQASRPARTTPPRPRPPEQCWPHRLPGTPGWLVRLVAPLSGNGPDMQALFADEDMRALIAAAPQLRRILRPICRMFAVTIPPDPAAPTRQGPGQRLKNLAPPRIDWPVVYLLLYPHEHPKTDYRAKTS